jgi:nucleotide-binding universal stress UspA family protein
MSDADKLVVVVPVDFSETSRRAMAWAFDYGQRAPCDIHLIHVIERHLTFKDLVDTSAEGLRRELDEVEGAAQQELAAMAPDQTGREQIGEIHHHIGIGKPADEIVRLAQEAGADMIVMGTHGLTGAVERLFVGSVAQKVVRQAPCTVVCVKPTKSA